VVESIYCKWNGNICKFLNKYLQEYLFLLPVIILIALLCILKILMLFVEFLQNIIPYDMKILIFPFSRFKLNDLKFYDKTACTL
jgi:hypothetical protein